MVTSPFSRWPSGPSGTLERPCGGLSGLWPSYRLWRWYGAGEQLLVGRLTSCTLALRRSPHICAGITQKNTNTVEAFFQSFPIEKIRFLNRLTFWKRRDLTSRQLYLEFYLSVPPSMSTASAVVFQFYELHSSSSAR